MDMPGEESPELGQQKQTPLTSPSDDGGMNNKGHLFCRESSRRHAAPSVAAQYKKQLPAGLEASDPLIRFACNGGDYFPAILASHFRCLLLVDQVNKT